MSIDVISGVGGFLTGFGAALGVLRREIRAALNQFLVEQQGEHRVFMLKGEADLRHQEYERRFTILERR